MTRFLTYAPKILFALALVSSLFFGTNASAQVQEDELRATIRSEILSDERSRDMSETEVDLLVDALAGQAQAEGMTAEDITWQPSEDAAFEESASCEGFLCALNHAFGFDGSDYTIPIMLGACALALIFIIATILEYHHLHRKKMMQSAVPPTPPVA